MAFFWREKIQTRTLATRKKFLEFFHLQFPYDGGNIALCGAPSFAKASAAVKTMADETEDRSAVAKAMAGPACAVFFDIRGTGQGERLKAKG